MKKYLIILAVAIFAITNLFSAENGVVVFDPDGSSNEGTNRFKLLPEKLDQTAAWLKEAGIPVTRLTAEQIADTSTFSEDKFDALIMPGDSFPKQDLKAIKRFTNEGGILIGLDCIVPFLVRMERSKDKSWKLSPRSPKFAWQTADLMSHFGIRYLWKPELHDSGMFHTVTEAFKSYLPPKASQSPFLNKIMGRWLPTAKDAVYYPLIESHRLDKQEVVPDLFIAKCGKAMAIVCTSGYFTNKPEQELSWPYGRETVIGMAKLASDLRHDQVDISKMRSLKITESVPLPEPLRTRIIRGKVDPEGTKPLARWGSFDGSSLELGGMVGAEQVVNVPVNAEAGTVPRGMEPGGSIRLACPSAPKGKSRFLRIRGAYNRGGGGLCVKMDDKILWNEQFSYIDTQGVSNFGVLAAGEPIEFNRIIFLPSGTIRTCEVRNTGESPIYFDAIQVELEITSGREWIVGFGVFDKPPFKVSSEISQKWPCIRASLRFERVGPPNDPKRWDRQNELLEFYKGICPRIHALIQNTPGWAAISEERLKEAIKGYRARDVAPDPQKYGKMLEYFLKNHSQGIDAFELWNEPELRQFFWGTRDEAIELFKVSAPMIRRLRPDAKIIGPGFAGHDMSGWLNAMHHAAVLDYIDWVAIHCYAGKTPAWDRIAYTYQGELYALGVGKPIYANEQGFPWRNAQWFQAPPVFTPWLQGVFTNIGLARLTAGGIEKVNVFMAYNPHDPVFDLFDSQGRPRPAYFAVKDYMELCRNGGKRLDVSMSSPDGKSLAGVYVAGAEDEKGNVTLVLNPAEIERLYPPKVPKDSSTEFDDKGDWTWFFGKASFEKGKAVLTVAQGKPYMGFASPVSIDPVNRPVLEIIVPESEKPWTLGLKMGKKELSLVGAGKSGTQRIDLRDFIASGGILESEIVFRVKGRTVFDAVRFLSPSSAGPGKPVKLFTTGSGHSFFGKTELTKKGLKLTPDKGKLYIGYNTDATIDTVRRPFLDFVVSECAKTWELSIKIGDKQTTLVKNASKGKLRIDLRKTLPSVKTATGTLTLRAFGPMVLESAQIVADPDAKIGEPDPAEKKISKAPAAPVPVVVYFPLTKTVSNASWSCGSKTGKTPVLVHDGPPQWGQIHLDLTGRTVVRIGKINH